MNLASNEGFGLGTCESLMSGTPIIVNVTGGLQDQCGFRKDGKLLTAEDYVEIGSQASLLANVKNAVEQKPKASTPAPAPTPTPPPPQNKQPVQPTPAV